MTYDDDELPDEHVTDPYEDDDLPDEHVTDPYHPDFAREDVE